MNWLYRTHRIAVGLTVVSIYLGGGIGGTVLSQYVYRPGQIMVIGATVVFLMWYIGLAVYDTTHTDHINIEARP